MTEATGRGDAFDALISTATAPEEYDSMVAMLDRSALYDNVERAKESLALARARVIAAEEAVSNAEAELAAAEGGAE